MKRFLKILCLCMAVAVIGGCFAGCNQANVEDQSLTYVALRINPEVEIVAQGDEVVAVNPINVDGEILATELEVIGKSVEQACEEVVNKATELGYIDVNAEEVNVNMEICGEKQEKVKELKGKIEEKVNKFFNEKGIYGKIKEEMHETYAEIEKIATENGISMHEAKLVSRILEVYPEKTIEEVLALSLKEKIELLKDNKNFGQIVVDFKDEYKQAVETIKEKYENMFDLDQVVKGLKEELEKAELTEEQKAEILAEIEAKMAEIKALKEAFKAEVSIAKESFKATCELKKAEYKIVAQQKINEHKVEIEKHLEKVEQNKEEIKSAVKEWQEKGEKKDNK